VSDIAERRRRYLEWIVESTDESGLDEYGGARWSLNHARLVLGRDLGRANRYFETVELDPRPRKWKSGKVDTADWDFRGIDLLRTLLDFASSPLLTDEAKSHLTSIFTGWRQPRPGTNRDNDRVARWPQIHTENHDIMLLTIGLFGEVLSGRLPVRAAARLPAPRMRQAGTQTGDPSGHVRELAKSLAWRFERGWIEWSSPCYQIHYLNPLLILADHAPSEALGAGARDLADLQLAERAVLSVNGHLGGPFYRGYDRHICDDRRDDYLPACWMALGRGAMPELGSGVHFASASFVPRAAVRSLAEEVASVPALRYRGTRAHCWATAEGCERRMIAYHNTPHVSMGSMRVKGYSFQSRIFNVMFADDPSKSVRTYLRDPEPHTVWDERNERGETAQHANWLVSRGSLVEEGGLRAESAPPWRLYRVGKGLCAHVELDGGWHVFQVADLDGFGDEREFLAALTLPEREGSRLRGRTPEGDRVAVDLSDMSVSVNGGPPEDWSRLLHDCPYLRSAYGSGVVEIATGEGSLTLTSEALRAEAASLPAPRAATRQAGGPAGECG
jgi:hypothetical protein